MSRRSRFGLAKDLVGDRGRVALPEEDVADHERIAFRPSEVAAWGIVSSRRYSRNAAMALGTTVLSPLSTLWPPTLPPHIQHVLDDALGRQPALEVPPG